MRARFGWMLIAALGWPMMAQNTASLAGVVRSEDGGPAAEAWVTMNRDYAPGLPVFTQSAVTDKAGLFQFAAVPAGSYSVCVQVPGQAVLDPCHWGGKPPRVSLKAGEAKTGLIIALRPAEFLHIRLNDPDKRVQGQFGERLGGPISIALWYPGGPAYFVRAAGQDDKGRDYRMAVPTDVDLRLTVSSDALDVEDTTPGGSSAEKDGSSLRFRFKQKKGSGPREIVLRVRGPSGK